MKHHPERTCVGCRGVFKKKEVVRVVAGPDGAVIDYREKLPGRAAYVCPRRECISKALGKEGLFRSLHIKGKPPSPEAFIGWMATAITERVKSLVSMAAKAGRLAAGYSAVLDALTKGRVELILFTIDIAEGTREKVLEGGAVHLPQVALFTKDELGIMLNREFVGVIGIEDQGLADAIREEARRLKNLDKSQRLE